MLKINNISEKKNYIVEALYQHNYYYYYFFLDLE